ncbi:MAG: methyltransferase domain-containing protein, partial [Rhodospirillaceae bacterium]|nr:methyltransferase domain-containing protein [Rhodospirillaceae bacterium]
VIFSAHGVPKAVPAEAAKREMIYVDATCPLVSKVHIEAERHHAAGLQMVMIGHEGHPETVGTMGQLPDGEVILVEVPEDVATVQVRDESKLAYVTQTTLSIDDTADVVISNCVINLSPDKGQVIAETFRVLKPGGRLAISDVVATDDFPEEITNDLHLLSGCVSGATPVDDLEKWMADAGFGDIRIDVKEESRATIDEWAPGRGIGKYVASATIEAVKPGAKKGCC